MFHTNNIYMRMSYFSLRSIGTYVFNVVTSNLLFQVLEQYEMEASSSSLSILLIYF